MIPIKAYRMEALDLLQGRIRTLNIPHGGLPDLMAAFVEVGHTAVLTVEIDRHIAVVKLKEVER